MCGRLKSDTGYAVPHFMSIAASLLASVQANAFFLDHLVLVILRDVSCRTHSAHGYGSADLARQAGSRYTPPGQEHLSCRSCDRKCSALEVEAVAAISCPCSTSAVADVVPGSRNRPTADVREGDRWAASEPEALLVVVMVVPVVAAVAVEDQIWHVCGRSTEPSSLCHSFA